MLYSTYVDQIDPNTVLDIIITRAPETSHYSCALVTIIPVPIVVPSISLNCETPTLMMPRHAQTP